MHSAPPTMTRSPRQAPGGAWATPVASATATPPIAISTPAVLRPVSGSTPSAAATTMVRSGKVDSASVPRAAVVYVSDTLKRTKNTAKNRRPRASDGRSNRRPRGHRLRPRESDRQQEQEAEAEAERRRASPDRCRRSRSASPRPPRPRARSRGRRPGRRPARSPHEHHLGLDGEGEEPPPASVTRVCHTMVRRPRCRHVASARSGPDRPAARKLVLDSRVAVVAPSGRLRNVAAAPTVSARAISAPPWTAPADRRHRVPDGELRDDPIGAGLDEPETEELGQRASVVLGELGQADAHEGPPRVTPASSDAASAALDRRRGRPGSGRARAEHPRGMPRWLSGYRTGVQAPPLRADAVAASAMRSAMRPSCPVGVTGFPPRTASTNAWSSAV